MAIISQETWDKFSEEEKEDIRHLYNGLETMQDRHIEGVMNSLFGKENLQSKPKIRTWKDMVTYNLINPLIVRESVGYAEDVCGEKIGNKVEATLKIAKLIEIAYGGMVTEEEWKYYHTHKYCIVLDFNGNPTIECRKGNTREFIAFHTHQQAEEFMSYPENVELVRQYYLL